VPGRVRLPSMIRAPRSGHPAAVLSSRRLAGENRERGRRGVSDGRRLARRGRPAQRWDGSARCAAGGAAAADRIPPARRATSPGRSTANGAD